MGVLKWIVTHFLALIPTLPVPSWLADRTGFVGQVMGYISGLGNWIPFSYAATGVALVLASMGVGALIKVGRMMLSVATGGGGSAG
jgi:hypothetical protein